MSKTNWNDLIIGMNENDFDQRKADALLHTKEELERMDRARKETEEGPLGNERLAYYMHRVCRLVMRKGGELHGWVNSMDAFGVELILGPDGADRNAARAFVFWDGLDAIEELKMAVAKENVARQQHDSTADDQQAQYAQRIVSGQFMEPQAGL